MDLAQYFSGAGISPSSDVLELMKALEVGHLRGGDPAAQSAGSLKVESLEKTLKILAEREEDMRIFNDIPKLPAYSTIEEFEQLTSYGNTSMSGFVGEGELPDETDETFVRQASLVKYIGVTRSISHQAMLVNTLVGDLKQRAATSASIWVLRKCDYAIPRGDSGPLPHAFDGTIKQQQNAFATLALWHDSDVVIDLRGDYLRESYIEQACQQIVDNHGFATDVYAPPVVLSNFVKAFHESKLIMPNTPAVKDGSFGQRVKEFNSQFGTINVKYDKFLKADAARRTTDGATHAKAPATPVPDGIAPATALADAGGTKFGAAYAGDYFYGVSALNRYGESAVVQLGAGLITVAATESVDLKFAAGAGTYAATGYVIYRSKKDVATAIGLTDMFPIFKVSTTNLAAGYDGGAASLIRDRNRFIPDTNVAFVLENNDQIWSLKQLLPLVKMDLARISPAERFMVMLYATPQLYAPRKKVVFLNVGAYVAP